MLQAPATRSPTAGQPTALVYGRVYEAGFTDAAGASSQIFAQCGYGPSGTSPATAGWLLDAVFNTQYGNDDEYQVAMIAPVSGSYSYTYRFSRDNGVSWTYCDTDWRRIEPGSDLLGARSPGDDGALSESSRRAHTPFNIDASRFIDAAEKIEHDTNTRRAFEITVDGQPHDLGGLVGHRKMSQQGVSVGEITRKDRQTCRRSRSGKKCERRGAHERRACTRAQSFEPKRLDRLCLGVS